MPLSPKTQAFVKRLLAVRVEKRIDPSRQGHIEGAIRDGRMTQKDLALFIRWLNTPDMSPTIAPPAYSPDDGWKKMLPDGSRFVGNGTAVLTILSKDMWAHRNDKDWDNWWAWLNSPNFVRGSLVAALAALLDNPQPLDDGYEGLDPSPSSLDLP